MQNPDIARLFDEVADLLEIQSQNPFRVRAYRNAARVVRDYPRPLGDEVGRGVDLTEIPGIGEDLAEKISTIVRTGDLPLHKELAAKLPSGLLDLLRIPGLGPKRVKMLYSKLKVKSAADLEKALEAGKVRKLAGFGPKMEENVRAGLGAALHVERRLLLPEVETHATALVEHLRTGGGLTNLAVAGSYRRRLESIGDLAARLAQLGGNPVEAELAVHLLLGLSGDAPRAAVQPVLVQLVLLVLGDLAQLDVVRLGAGEVHEGGAVRRGLDHPQIHLQSAAQLHRDARVAA